MGAGASPGGDSKARTPRASPISNDRPHRFDTRVQPGQRAGLPRGAPPMGLRGRKTGTNRRCGNP